MIDHWREVLYPLGFISSLAFTARFLVQWMGSEIKGRSIVTETFWKISLVGNGSLLVHSIIQGQFHVALIQACNGVISWRNLNLMQPPCKQVSLKTTLIIMVLSLLAVPIAFAFQGLESWFRMPVWLWQQTQISMGWHIAGFTGLVLFNSRFWVQWWYAEKSQASALQPSFWWMSLIGDLFCLAYFIHLRDIVNLIGPAFGLIPYVRNLMLIYKSKKIKAS